MLLFGEAKAKLLWEALYQLRRKTPIFRYGDIRRLD
jgi:hypothetical protein